MRSQAPSTSALGRRERRKLELNRRIAAAAVALFRRQGYEATTVEQIAERADVAKGTVFNYFATKESLLHAMSADLYARLVEDLGAPGTWTGGCREQVMRVLLALARLAREDLAVFRLVLNRSLRDFLRDAQQSQLARHFHVSLRRAFESGRVRGELRPGVRVEAAARLVTAAFNAVLLDWLNDSLELRAFHRELRDQLDIVFAGIGARGRAPRAARAGYGPGRRMLSGQRARAT